MLLLLTRNAITVLQRCCTYLAMILHISCNDTAYALQQHCICFTATLHMPCSETAHALQQDCFPFAVIQ